MKKIIKVAMIAVLFLAGVAQAAPNADIPLTKHGWIMAVRCAKGEPIPGIPGAVTMPDADCKTGGLANDGAAVTCSAVLSGGSCSITLPAGFSKCQTYGIDGITPVNPGTTVTLGGSGNQTHFNCKK